MHPRPDSHSPTHSRPSSSRRDTAGLPGIPEARPGPNAFSLQAARMERHRMDGNAFYQQEVNKRRVTPPNSIHPALREQLGSISDAPSLLHVNTQHLARDSTATTMSPFINAGKKPLPSPSPKQDSLIPSDEYSAHPTQRGYIEERCEAFEHKRSGSEEERTPVYTTYAPTPKAPTGEFESNSTPRKMRISLPKKDSTTFTDDSAPKSPKKFAIFNKLRMPKFTGGTPSPSMTSLSGAESFVVEEAGIPVKAQAVLGSGRSMNALTRSPSKQKKNKGGSLTSRKAAEMRDIATSITHSTRMSASTDAHNGPRTGSTTAKTPQTAYTSVSDLSHYSFVNGKRIASQTLSERGCAYNEQAAGGGKCAIQRSQSLKYFDPGVPPTPPAKNTPPDQKAQAMSGLGITSRDDIAGYTPSKLPGVVSTSDRLSPTKFGSYAHKDTPRLVTKPSVYSLHASVVPSNMDASAFEEAKARLDGLGVEGFSMPAETHHRGSPEMVYSPSVYSPDWRNSIASRHGQRLSWSGLPSVLEAPSEPNSSAHKVQKSSSSNESGETIEICYPELALDPSMEGIIPEHVRDIARASMRVGGRSCDEERRSVPVHGRTQSRDHSSSPTQSIDMETMYGVKLEGDKVDRGIFAMPEHSEHGNASPVSFSQKSAMPSPLQYLPATVYTPPPPRGGRSRRPMEQTPVPRSKQGGDRCRNSGLGIHHNEMAHSEMSLIDLPGDGIMDSAPVLAATPRRLESVSPRASTAAYASDQQDENVDPEKPGYASGKMDKVLAMLNKLTVQSESVEAMRDEMRATNARLNARLSAVEDNQRSSSASPTSSSIAFGPDGASSVHEESVAGRGESRVPTDVARDFYRLGRSQGPPSEGTAATSVDARSLEPSGEQGSETEADRIEKLTETNRQLTEMVQGFAAELEAMKRKMGGCA